MGIKYGMTPTEAYRSFRVDTSREILRCSGGVKYFITQVSVITTLKGPICINPDEIKAIVDKPDTFCIQNINARFNSRVTPQWQGKQGANSSWAMGSVLNKIMDCEAGLYIPYSEITITIRGRGNPETVEPSVIPLVVSYLQNRIQNFIYIEDYVRDPLTGQTLEYIDMGTETDIDLSDWETGSKDFFAVTLASHSGPNYVENHSFNINLETGIGEWRIEKTIYDNTDTPDLSSIITTLKTQA